MNLRLFGSFSFFVLTISIHASIQVNRLSYTVRYMTVNIGENLRRKIILSNKLNTFNTRSTNHSTSNQTIDKKIKHEPIPQSENRLPFKVGQHIKNH